jgi:hypothetical protein
MCLSYLFNSYKIIFTIIVLAFNVINVLSKYEIVEKNPNVTVSVLSYMESKFLIIYIIHHLKVKIKRFHLTINSN